MLIVHIKLKMIQLCYLFVKKTFFCDNWGSHSSVPEDPSLLGCDSMLINIFKVLQ